jgi:hypothetical protein
MIGTREPEQPEQPEQQNETFAGVYLTTSLVECENIAALAPETDIHRQTREELPENSVSPVFRRPSPPSLSHRLSDQPSAIRLHPTDCQSKLLLQQTHSYKTLTVPSL